MKLAFVGFEVRERYANDPRRPLEGYPLGLGNVTIDSHLCRRPRLAQERVNADKPVEDRRRIMARLRVARESNDGSFAAFGYRLDTPSLETTGLLEVPEWPLPAEWVRCGLDVADVSRAPKEWSSVVANEGLSLAQLERFGPINSNGLYEDIESAVGFRDTCTTDPGEGHVIAIVEVWMLADE